MAILYNDGTIEQIIKISSTENRRAHVKLVETGQVVSEKKTLKDYRILYLDIAQWQGQIIHGEQNFDCN